MHTSIHDSQTKYIKHEHNPTQTYAINL